MNRLAWISAAILLAATVQAGDFQPHSSHAPPPPPAVPPPPPPPPKFPPPNVIKFVDPEYPAEALLYNAQVTVGLKISVNANGKVADVEVMNDYGAFGENAARAARKWKFEKRPEGSTLRLAVPFRVDRNVEYRFDTGIRPIAYKPAVAADVQQELIFGFEYVRLMIDPAGNVVGKFVEGGEPAEFKASADAIIATLKFAPAEPETLHGGKTVNSFLVDYANDGVIRIQQRGGKPAY